MTNETTMIAAEEVSESGLLFVSHSDAMHFKNYAVETDGQKELQSLIDAGKLTIDDISITEKDVTKDKATTKVTYWKRKSVSFTVQVPDVTTLVQPDLLTAAELAHLQAVIAQRLVDKQKAEIADLTGKTVTFADVFGAAFTQRVAAVKVSAEALKLALEYLKAGLAAIGTNPKGLPRILEMASKRFSAASAAGLSPDALAVIDARVTAALPVAAEAAVTEGESEDVTNALDMLDKAMRKLMAPPEAMTADQF